MSKITPFSQAANSLGVAKNMLHKWKDKIKAQLEGKVLEEYKRDEFKRLRKENKPLLIEMSVVMTG